MRFDHVPVIANFVNQQDNDYNQQSGNNA